MTSRSAITGTTHWLAQIPGRCTQVTASGAEYIVIGTRVFGRLTGRVLWRERGWSGSGASMGTTGDIAPVVDGPTVVVVRNGEVTGRRPLTGRVVWTRRTPPITAGGVAVGPNAVVGVQKLASGGSTTRVIAWNRATGRTMWSGEIPAGSITVTRRAVIVVEGAVSRVQGFDLRTGIARWWRWGVAGTNEPIGAADDVAVMHGPDGIEAVDDASGVRRWTLPNASLFRVQPDSRVAAIFRVDHDSVQLVDLRSGATRAEISERQSEIFPLSSASVIRAGRAHDERVGFDGTELWTVRRPEPTVDLDAYLVGNDLVTIRDRCLR